MIPDVFVQSFFSLKIMVPFLPKEKQLTSIHSEFASNVLASPAVQRWISKLINHFQLSVFQIMEHIQKKKISPLQLARLLGLTRKNLGTRLPTCLTSIKLSGLKKSTLEITAALQVLFFHFIILPAVLFLQTGQQPTIEKRKLVKDLHRSPTLTQQKA